MSLSGRITVLCALAVVCAVASGEAEELTPGKHRRIVCKGAPQWTYDLYVPTAYGEDAERLFPVLFLSSPGGNPGTYGMDNWAERNSVILVSINDTRNDQDPGLGKPTWVKIQGTVVDSVEARLRLHPCLRFSMGISGAAWASMILAGSYPDKYAGVVMLAHSGNGSDRKLKRHIAVAFIHAENDDVHGPGSVRGAAGRLRSRGNPVRVVCGDWGHSKGPLEEREKALDWMLARARLMHPNLPAAERKAAIAEVKRRIQELAGITSAAQRLGETEALFQMPDVDKWPEAKQLYSAWFSAKYELAAAEEDSVARHEALTDLSEDERVRKCASGDKRRLVGELKKLRRKSPVKEEWLAKKNYQRIAEFEKKAGRQRAKLIQVARSYNALAKRYPRTKAGRRAAEEAKRIVDKMNSGKR